MKSKKIVSIIALASISVMNTQSLAVHNNKTNNIVLLSQNKNEIHNDKSNINLDSNTNELNKNSITIMGNWNGGKYKTDVISFNRATKKINISGSMTAYFGNFSGKAVEVSLYSNDGKVIKSKTYNSGDRAQSLYNDFNNLDFNYGDIIQITPLGPVETKVSNFNGKADYSTNKTLSMQITQNGLKQLNGTLKVNPVYYVLNSNKLDISGKTIANTEVYFNIDNKEYNVKSNENGEFNLNINADKEISASTNIEVYVKGEQIENIKPVLNDKVYGIIKNHITLMGNWDGGKYKTDVISFNPVDMKINIGGSMAAYFGNFSGKAFEVSLYSKNGNLIKSKTYDANNTAQNLYNDFNNLGFNYGDIIKITCLGPVQTNISNFSAESNYESTKSVQISIEQDGLKFSNMHKIEVNPFEVLGNGKVTSGVISGKVDKSNQEVDILVDGKKFSGKSDASGEFKVSISDNSGFTTSTNIVVETSGELAKIINPTADLNLGILKSNICIGNSDMDGLYGNFEQTISFNPANMSIISKNIFGRKFAAQLISGKTGQVLASCGATDFTVYTSKNNLNGAHFEYGDMIAVYEPQESELSEGELLLDSGKSKIDCTNKFKCFKITPNGLVPVANKNLTTSGVLYKGNNNMSLTGKTLPNTNVTISYGDISKVVKSNSDGDFLLEIPVSKAPINSEVRVFVNNDNNEILTVKYDTKLININSNRVEILNNTNVPVFNITFNPVDSKLQVTKYPLTMGYTGAFYGNSLNIRFIDPKTGKVIYSFAGDKLNDINSFVSAINNKSYSNGDIIEISYNPSFIKANILNDKDSIGNTTGEKEYFEITKKGLVNLNDKFINVKPLDILSNTKVTSTNIEGTAKPNTSVEVSVDGNVFKGITNGNGDFNITISDKNGFTSNTNIVVSSEGYIPTTINPTIQSNIELMNSYINFYNNSGWEGKLSSSITFNPQTMKFIVNNYTNSFGDGKSHYFNFDLYNSNGDKILSSSFSNGATSQLTEALNDKSFNYGDIIGLSYNKDISRPVVLDGNNILSNISGTEEYFKITKGGLVKVNFGQGAYTTNVSWDNNNLVIDSNLADGQSENVLSADKKLVILDSNNKIVDLVNTSILNNNQSSVQGVISESSLDKLNKDETYTFALDIDNKLFPIKVTSNTSSNSEYVLEANSDNVLSIVAAKKKVVTINNSGEISSYLNELSSDIKSAINTNDNINILTNSELNYKITANEFITRVGVGNLENFFNKSQANKEFINWVLNNKIAMQYYLEGTNSTGVNINGLQIWSDIWNKYTNSRSGFNLKLAVAVAISNAHPINAWPGQGTVGNPVERYNIFETLNAEGGMVPLFRTLDVRHIMYVVNTYVPNSEILEARAIIMQNHNAYLNDDGSGLYNIFNTIRYNENNPYTGASVFRPGFYGSKPSILDVWYDGGVCGALSHMGAMACELFGIPAQPIGQPGHCAFVFYNNNHKWNIGNNIFGWKQSQGADISGWSDGIATNIYTTNYNLLYENINSQTLKKSNEYLWLASSDVSYQDKMNAINEALKIEPLNIRAWLAKINLMKTNHNLTINDYINLSEQIISALKDYPMPMYDVLLQIKSVILNNGTSAQYNEYVNSINKALGTVNNANQKPIAQSLINSMPKNGLEKGNTPLINSKITIDNYWGNALGTLTFNTPNKKIVVEKGWSRISAYVHGEAFSIGLYNKNNKALKTLTLHGGEWPKDEIYNAFNNLGFEYGDKIFIDYKTSCRINASNSYKDGILQKSYNVNKPSVFEITPRGLVYLGDNLENSSENSTLNVSTVYPDGKIVTGDKYNYKETGMIGDAIKNEGIPVLENYHIDYITVNGVKTDINQLPKYYLSGDTNIVYHMASEDKYKLNINVKTEDGKILNTMPVVSYSKGDKISVSDNNFDKNDYRLDYILVDGVKTPADKLPEFMPNKDLSVTYVVSPRIMNVAERVVNQNGDVLYNKEYKLPFDTSVVNIEDKIPSNYKLENITVSNENNTTPTLIANTKVNAYTNSNDVKVTFNNEVVSYNVVPVNGEVTYETQIGNEKPINVKKEVGQIDTKVNEYKLNIPKGYEVESITVNGNKVSSVNDLDYKNEKQVVIYHLAKISDNKSKQNNKIVEDNDKSVIKHKNDTKPSNHKADKSGNTENKPVVNHDDQKKVSVDKHDNKSVVKPKENNTENKPVINNNDGNKQSNDKHDLTPAKIENGEVIVKVIDQNGKVIEKATHTGELGVKFKPISIPSKDKLVNVTVNGKIVSENDIKNEIVSNSDTDNKTTIIYTVNVPEKKNNNQGSSVNHADKKHTNSTIDNKDNSKDTHDNTKPVINHNENKSSDDKNKTNIEDGYIKIEVRTDNGRILLDSNYNEPIGSKINNVVIPKGYKLQAVSATVNGNKVQEVPTKVEKGNTTIIYTVASDNPVANHNENTDKHSDVKPVVNHNKDNTNKHGDEKPVVNHSKDNTNKHSDAKSVVNHSKDNTDKHNNVKPVVNHNEDNTDKHDNVKPVVNHNENNTDKHSDVNSTVNHSDVNSNKENSKSTAKEVNGETVIKKGLPDTGLKNTEDGLGILAGIMAAIATLGIFRRKNNQ